MNREVGRFLLETWQMFYWSFFCPSQLQERINNLWLREAKIGFQKNSYSFFIFQYCLIPVIISLPLAILVFLSGQKWHWLFWLTTLLISYGLGVLLLPSGLGSFIPVLSTLIYWQQFELFTEIWQSLLLPVQQAISQILLHPQQFLDGFTKLNLIVWIVWIYLIPFLFIGCFITSSLIFSSEKNSLPESMISDDENTILGGAFLPVLLWSRLGIVFGILFGLTINNNNLIIVFVNIFSSLLTNELIGIFLSIVLGISLGWIFNDPGSPAILIIIGFGIALAFFTSSAITFFITFFVASLNLTWFLFFCALVALACAPIQHRWLGLWTSIFFVLVGWEKLSFNVFFAIPVSLVCYCRIFPDYLFACLFRLVFTQPGLENFVLEKPDSFLAEFIPFTVAKMPPYTTELLWLPLPNHTQMLVGTFSKDTALGLATFKKMQAISLPGFQITIQKSLPAIVADRFATIRTTAELINSITPSQPLLPFLIPAFYQPDEITRFAETSKSGKSEIDIVFLILQRLVQDILAALQGGSSALRERGLERLVDQLKKLPSQLPELGLKPQAVKRWQPAIRRWQDILTLEIAEQQKTSQGEFLNPFQYGNPLRPDRAAIFKGRQDFADRLVRSILDRNCPTLVLHGPRRAGKTSFLLNLPRLLPSDLVPIYLDMQQSSMTASEGDFCYGLVRAIDRDTRSQGLQLPPIPSRQDFATKPYPTLEDWLDLALPKLGERRLLLNLDEFEKIGSAIKDNRISERLFDQLRSMIQHYDRLGFLFSGVQTLEELGPRWSNYFISVVPMEMQYLERHEAEDLLLNPDPEFILQYDAGIVDEILRLTHCQPYLLQLIGSAIVNQANLQHTQLATIALLQTAIQDAFTNGEPYFTNIWTEFTGTTPAEVIAGQKILIALAQGNPHVETNDEPTTAARRRLLRYHVIERFGDIDKIEIPLFEQWVRERSIAAS